MRSASEALTVSLCSYGLATYAAGLYQGTWTGPVAKLSNASAREVAGVGRAAWLAVLLAVAGATTVKNLYNLKCVTFLDKVLSASGCTIEGRVRREGRGPIKGAELLPLNQIR